MAGRMVAFRRATPIEIPSRAYIPPNAARGPEERSLWSARHEVFMSAPAYPVRNATAIFWPGARDHSPMPGLENCVPGAEHQRGTAHLAAPGRDPGREEDLAHPGESRAAEHIIEGTDVN